MFMICLHTKFYMPYTKGSLFYAVKPKTKSIFRTAAMLVFYIIKTKCLNGSCILVWRHM